MSNRGCRLRPTGPLIAADLRKLVKRMDELNLSDYADVEITTPIAGDRRAATISVVDYEAAITEDAIADQGDGTQAAPAAEPEGK